MTQSLFKDFLLLNKLLRSSFFWFDSGNVLSAIIFFKKLIFCVFILPLRKVIGIAGKTLGGSYNFSKFVLLSICSIFFGIVHYSMEHLF